MHTVPSLINMAKLVVLAVVLASLVADSAVFGFDCQGVEVVPRYQWGAQSPIGQQHMDLPLYHVFISHTVSSECNSLESCSQQVRNIQNYHRNNLNWGDIGYSFLIGGDGRVYVGRGPDVVGAHTRNYNSESWGISFIGNYQNKAPNAKMQNAAKKLIACGVDKGYLSPSYQLHGHRDATCTASPGNTLYEIIKKWPHFKAGRLPKYSC